MLRTGRHIMGVVVTLFFFLALCQTSYAAFCPCYDYGHIHSLFKDNENAYCHVFKRNYKILKVQIVGDGEIAESTLEDCEMTVDEVTLSREYESPFIKEHTNHCMEIILSACNSLRLRMVESR